MAELVQTKDDDVPDHWSDHAESEVNEKQLEVDLKEMREVCKYGVWGTGNALQKEVDLWLPRQEDDLANEAAQTQQQREALQGIESKPPWWEGGQSTDSEPDSWGTQSTPEEPSPKRSARKSAKKLSGFGGHAMTRVSKYEPGQKEADAESEDSVEIEGFDERGFVVDPDETKEQ